MDQTLKRILSFLLKESMAPAECVHNFELLISRAAFSAAAADLLLSKDAAAGSESVYSG